VLLKQLNRWTCSSSTPAKQARTRFTYAPPPEVERLSWPWCWLCRWLSFRRQSSIEVNSDLTWSRTRDFAIIRLMF